MKATINLEKKHFPVLLNELISIISPLYGGTFIDCTFGNGGYSSKILENNLNSVVALDRDLDVRIYANNLKKKFPFRFEFYNSRFSEINNLNLENKKIKGIIFDLGYSLDQIMSKTKGLSFKSENKLNMQMGLNDISANDVINNMSQQNINNILKYYGDEKKSKIISKIICERRKTKLIKTNDLVKIINIVKKKPKSKIHNATKSFQALRIFVNQEISELMYGLINAFKILPIGGIMVIVTFNSIEDRIVKFFFKNYSESQNTSRYLPEASKKLKLFKLVNKKPILPSEAEIKINPPSRSAKMRYAFKIKDINNFKEFFNKFEKLIKIEELRKEI